MKKKKAKVEDRIFSIFKVYDYKGGELSSTTNIDLDYVVSELIESGIIEHKEIEYSDDIYGKKDEDIRRICSECDLKDNLYAGGDNGPVLEIFEHKDNKLTSVYPSEFQPLFADYIIKNK